MPAQFDDGSDLSGLSGRLFTWILDDQVLAMRCPGPGDLAALNAEGITKVISLTLSPLPDHYFDNSDITPVHMPLPDMSTPSVQNIHEFVKTLSGFHSDGHKVAVHCGAGLGRTGTMLACYLVSRGMSSDEAIAQVRSRRPGSVESRGQEAAIRAYEAEIKG